MLYFVISLDMINLDIFNNIERIPRGYKGKNYLTDLAIQLRGYRGVELNESSECKILTPAAFE